MGVDAAARHLSWKIDRREIALSFFELAAIALALAVDAFSIGVAVGLTRRTRRERFRLSFHFGLFQALMPLIGALAGCALERWISRWDHWVAFALLAVIGGRMIWNAARGGGGRESAGDPTRGLRLVGLSLAVSIDALAVGFTLGIAKVSIPFAVSLIGVTAAALTLVGMVIAGGFASRLGRRAEIVAGGVLVVIGVKIVLEHTGVL
ncbi:MAG: manganese efflux pump MntP family protein [Proteobacteria bacterium]|nr:manganese efflux pump MntP family protein [Pseudomonadota bacterium]